jgi:hypothetical protein
MYNLMAFCICVMVGNAEAERVFSIENRIKTRLRISLTIERLDQIIRLSDTGGETGDIEDLMLCIVLCYLLRDGYKSPN